MLTQGVARDQLTIHADRGGSMRSKPVSQLMMDLGITRSHSRPHVSNDNPFSEAAFKTLKYCPTFPERFGCIEDARAFADVFFNYYNHVHRHSGIGLHTPASVHYGTHHEIREQRQATLNAAFESNPIRFRRIAPRAPTIPKSCGSTRRSRRCSLTSKSTECLIRPDGFRLSLSRTTQKLN